ncbi:NUDIX hydrolase [Cognatishimia maritima]|uniref:ADP-ribose pyrophosphatase YjhB, NUDIX family n=1 Tax=Cognatishimia maritima TaxID=870908 RepID=A0A1M5VRX0_9RHOB|nr:NUDIX hydrolase [Cognatishimia maritima]SHH77928.1 ADP-ribose pyrophosphatase YjhB, NUDIX family [Cognatishimia maritima]
MSAPTLTPKVGAIAVILRDGHFLMVQRGKAPGIGLWGFPGGHVELGETAQEAAVRELFEETTVIGTPQAYLTNVDVIGRDEDGAILYHYLLAVVPCTYVSGIPKAGDDAAAAEWVPVRDVVNEVRPLSWGVAKVAKQIAAKLSEATQP